MERREELLRSARHAYERGRLWKAMRTSSLVPLMTVVSLRCCENRTATFMIAGVLALLTTGLVWRGGSAGRGVVPGLVAGIVPLVVPSLVCSACEAMGVISAWPLVACVLGGVGSGAIVTYYAAQVEEHRGPFVLAAGAVAALAGSLGCVLEGLSGIAAMTVGLTLIAPLGLRTMTRTAV